MTTILTFYDFIFMFLNTNYSFIMNFTDKKMEETNICGICLEPLAKNNICITRCGHAFCLTCIIKNTNYNNNCPYCRIEIIEKENEEETEEDEEDDDYANHRFRYGRSIDDCYYFPMVIEDIHVVAEVINEVSGGVYQSGHGLGFIIGMLSLINENENEETKFNFMDDKCFENEMPFAENVISVFTEVIFRYKRSILLNKCLKNKWNNPNN